MALTIKDWIELNDITASEFAKSLGVSQSTICKHLNAYQRLAPETAESVEKLTKGKVSRLYAMWPDLLDMDWERAYRKHQSDKQKAK
jgi:DNA-binding transcriptional regulator YdaS (Cro superfamily)